MGLLLPNRDWAQHQLAAMLCCCYHGTSMPCALAFFCPVLCLLREALPQHSEAAVVAVAMPPSQQGHSPQELGLVTLQCSVFYSLGLAPDPLCTPAGRPGLAITSPPSSLSAAFTWAPLNKQFTFSQAGSVPGFLSVHHPKPDRSCSVSAVGSRHHSIQN